jgi:fluoride exporter
MKHFLLVGLGGAIGSILRYGSSLLIPAKSFPASTLLVNVAGSFIIGAVWALSIKSQWFSDSWKLFLATGICGGFTTFSTFSLENMQLLQQGKYALLTLYIGSSICLGLLAVMAGYKLLQ